MRWQLWMCPRSNAASCGSGSLRWRGINHHHLVMPGNAARMVGLSFTLWKWRHGPATSVSVIICQKGHHLTYKITRLLRMAGSDMNSWHKQNWIYFEMPYFVLEWKRGLSPVITSHDFIKWNLTCQGRWGHSCCSVAQSCLTLCANPMDCSTPGLPSFTISQSFLKLMSIEYMMPSNHLILYPPFSSCPQPFPAGDTETTLNQISIDGRYIG